MTKEQKYKLQKAIESITDSLKEEKVTDPKIISIWLSVASDYCREVAGKIVK
jgi:hypothetical protein